MPFVKRKQLGKILLDNRAITPEQLNEGLHYQQQTGVRLGQALTQLGYISEEYLTKLLSEQLGLPWVELRKTPVDSNAVSLLTETQIEQYEAIPINRKNNTLVVAMVDPLNVYAIDDIKMITGLDVEPVITTKKDILWAAKQFTNLSAVVSQAEDENSDLEPLEEDFSKEGLQERIRELAEEGPVVYLVNSIIIRAVLNRVSDIHIEPQEDEVLIRYRVDGRLIDAMSFPKNRQSAIISRVKVMADMDIAERRLPQDGRIQMRIEGRDIDFRVSSLPSIHGEKIVLRILDKTVGVRTIEQLDYSRHNYKTALKILSKPHGIVLVTGPTGSGKSTSLYAYLNKLNTIDKNIITVEDPVEYTLPRITQVQVNTKAGLTFARCLRSILRQDPDIIMIGEIRDSETAQIAIQAALTGHLVLSTLHTNSAVSSITRLIDMGIEPFLIASSLVGIVSQRLVRRICPECKEEHVLSPELAQTLGLPVALEGKGIKFSRGKGCPSCFNTGFRGRMAIHEVMEFTDDMREAVIQMESENVLLDLARQKGFRTMKEDGVDKAIQGITSVEEVLKVVLSKE